MNINPYPNGWYDALHRQLADLHHHFPDAHIYALIDGVLNESCYPLLKQSGRLPYEALYANAPAADEETLCVSPLVVEYVAAEQNTWNALLRKTNGLPACSLIVSPESLAQLATRLAPWCVVDAAGQTLALSFADTRILPELCKTLTARQLSAFVGPALRWQYVTRNAEWRTLPLPETALPPADTVGLDEQQCAQLIAASEVDGVLYQLRKNSDSLVDCHSPARAHEIVCHWLACADHAQIDAGPERVRLCELGFMHPALEHDPRIAAWLAMPSQAQTFEACQAQWTGGSPSSLFGIE